MSCNTTIVRLEWEVLNFLHTVPLFFNSVFLFKAAVIFWALCVCHSTSLWVAAHCCWSAHWDSRFSMQTACHGSDTIKRPAVDMTCKNSTKRKQTETLMSPLWRCSPRRLSAHRHHVSASASVYLVKQNYMKAAHLKARDGEIKDVKVSVSVPVLSFSAFRSALSEHCFLK